MESTTQKLIHTFGSLADLGQEVAASGDFDEMVRTSLHLLLGTLAIRRGAVLECDSYTEALDTRAVWGLGEDFRSVGIEVIVPMIVRSELTGLILLGDKASGEPFSSDDFEIVHAMARHI